MNSRSGIQSQTPGGRYPGSRSPCSSSGGPRCSAFPQRAAPATTFTATTVPLSPLSWPTQSWSTTPVRYLSTSAHQKMTHGANRSVPLCALITLTVTFLLVSSWETYSDFMFPYCKSIVKYNLDTREMSVFRRPSWRSDDRVALMATEDGRLQLAVVNNSSLNLWLRQDGGSGDEGWAICRVIRLKKLITSRPFDTRPYVVLVSFFCRPMMASSLLI